MSRWFRFYDDAVNDPKVQRLPGDKFKAWVNLLCLASKNDGVLPSLADISFALRLSEDKVSSILNEFCEKGLLDPVEVEGAPMSYAPHNWDARQFKSDKTDPTAASRQKAYRYRNKNRDGDRNAAVTVTPPRAETEQIQKETDADASGAEAPPDPSEPERQFFKRGREVLGKSSGGQLAKLLKAAGGNIALARSKIELAATKDSAHEFIAKVITTAGTGPPAKPLTQHQIERQESREILNDLQKFIDDSSGRGGDADLGLLRFDTGDGQESVHGGVRRAVVDLPASRSREGS